MYFLIKKNVIFLFLNFISKDIIWLNTGWHFLNEKKMPASVKSDNVFGFE